MLHYKLKSVVFDLDDFSEEIMTRERWQLIIGLKKIYPKLKLTMFTVPLQCTRSWLEMIKRDYPWMELHYHGSNHIDRKEWMDKTDFDFPFTEFFYKGFKAPWWMLGESTVKIFQQRGFLLSSMVGPRDIKAIKGVYRFNIGKCHIKDVWYENRIHHATHSHVQEQKLQDGLPDIFEQLATAFRPDSDFLFISEAPVLYRKKSEKEKLWEKILCTSGE